MGLEGKMSDRVGKTMLQPGLEPAPAPDPGEFSPDSCQYVSEIFLSGELDAGAGGVVGAGQLPVC